MMLETKRLILRKWTAADIDVLYEMCSDPEVMRFIADGKPWTTIERAQLWLDRVAAAYEANGFGRFAVVEKQHRLIIGSCGFGMPAGSNEIDFGYVFKRNAWGRGFATEAARACLDFGFSTLGFKEVIASTDPDNSASRHVLEKLGFEFRGFRVDPGDVLESTFYVARNPRNSDWNSRHASQDFTR